METHWELIPGTTLQGGRFVIQKVLASKSTGSIYLAHDQKVTDRDWVLKEIIPPVLPAEERTRRYNRFHKTVEAMTTFRHPNLPKVLGSFTEGRRHYLIMEFIEGTNLEAYGKMLITPMNEKQVLKWAVQLCDVLNYLHDRPEPFYFRVLTPANLMVNRAGHIKLINFGLDMVFNPAAPRAFFDPTNYPMEARGLAEMLYLLLTKELLPEGARKVPRHPNFSPELARIMDLCISPELPSKCKSFAEIGEAFKQVLSPRSLEEVEKEARRHAWADVSTLKSLPGLTVNWFRAQHPITLGIMGTIVLAGILTWWFITHPIHKFTRHGPIAVVLCGTQELVAVDLLKLVPVGKVNLPTDASSLLATPDGKFLYVSCPKLNQVMVLNGEHLEIKGQVKVEQNPGKMVWNTNYQSIFIINPGGNSLSQISAANLTVLNLLTAGNDPRDALVSSYNGNLYVSNSRSATITSLNPSTGSVNATITVDEDPEAMAITPDGQRLFIAHRLSGIVSIISTVTNRVFEQLESTGGREPVALGVDAKGLYLFAANAASGNLGIINLASGELKTLPVGGKPSAMAFTPSSYTPMQLWLADQERGSLFVVDVATQKLVTSIDVGTSPSALTIMP